VAAHSGEVPPSLYQAVREHHSISTAAAVAAAISHAVGTPLNVITGRAELINRDPANAAAHAARIEEQARKLASGLRQLTDYLTPKDEDAADEVPAAQALEEARSLADAFAASRGVVLALDTRALGAAKIDRKYALGILSTLIEWAVRYRTDPTGAAGAATVAQTTAAQTTAAQTTAAQTTAAGQRLVIKGSVVDNGSAIDEMVAIEFEVPALEAVAGWRLEKFESRTSLSENAEPYRVLSLCSALARIQGGGLTIEPLSTSSSNGSSAGTGAGIRVRLLCAPNPARTAPAEASPAPPVRGRSGA
jgi:hypothetical protein